MYDLIIVGAGPAGTSAALYGNRLGLQTLLLDKSKFPRDKTCGDALSGKSVKILDDLNLVEGVNKLDGSIIKRIIFANPKHSECELLLDKSLNKDHISHGYVIPRITFDNYMLEQAKKVSDVEEGFFVKDLLFDDKRVVGVSGKTNNGDHKEYRANIVLGADGPNSIVSKKAGLYQMDIDHTAIGIRCYYENVKDLTDQIELHYIEEMIPGYFWIFPAGKNRANIGVGLLKSIVKKESRKLSEIMTKIIESDHFKDRFSDAVPIEKPTGWNLPFGSIKRENHGEGFLLLGDAAGLVDPFTGEGIGNAMESGRIAVETAAKAKEKNDFSKSYLKKYDTELWEYLGSELNTSARLLKISRSKFLLNFVIDRASRNKKVRDIMSGMLSDEIPKTELSNPLFYLKILFS
jgi:geranylgeranyl reductase family protein